MSHSDFEITLSALGDIDDLRHKWITLQERVNPSFFLTWSWMGCWLNQTGEQPLVLEARHAGRIAALALLKPSNRRSYGRFPGRCIYLHQTGIKHYDQITIEYNGVLADTKGSPGVLEACIDHIVSGGTGVPRWDEFYLGGVEPSYAEYFLRYKSLALIRREKYAAAVDLEVVRSSDRSYLESLSSNTRYQIRRAMRLYEQMGELTITSAPDVATAIEYLHEIGPMHIAHWNTKGYPSGFSDPFFVSFHTALISQGLPRGEIELLRLKAGHNLIGYLYNFIYNRKVYFYLSAFNYGADAKIKPGLVSHTLAINYYMNKGILLYDFMAGGDRYKKNLKNTESEMLWLIVQKRKLKFMLEDALRGIKHTLINPQR